jgi:glucose/arabinose dehydrogenase
MKKPIVIIGIILAAAGLGAAAFYWESWGPVPILPPPRDIVKLLEEPSPPEGKGTLPSSLPLKLPPGFAISVFAGNVPGARVLALDPDGTLLVSLTSRGKVVALPDKNGDGVADAVVIVLDGLNKPHGLAFGPEEKPRLYVAETRRVGAFDYDPERLTATNERKIADLPPGGRHLPGPWCSCRRPNHQLLISVGSSCDVCEEKDPRYASILAVDADGGNLETFARGLRNSVFMAVHPLSRHVWATEMGRDYLGDDLPPDEINILLEGGHYGWPYCYGKRVHDDSFDPNGAHQEFCAETIPAFIDLRRIPPPGPGFFPKVAPGVSPGPPGGLSRLLEPHRAHGLQGGAL